MQNLLSGGFFPIFTIMAFIAVVLLLEGLYMIWNSYKGPEAKKIEQRLRALSAGSDSTERASVLRNRMLSEVPAIERLLLSIPRINNLDRLLVQANDSLRSISALSDLLARHPEALIKGRPAGSFE